MKSTFSLSSRINLWCSKSPGVILWTSARVYFFLVPTFPSTCLVYFPHSPKLLRPPLETGCELAPFNQMYEWGCMKSFNVLSFSCGEAAPFPQNLKLAWRCKVSGLFFCNWGCMSLLFSDEPEQTVSTPKRPSIIQTWLNIDDILNLWMVSKSTEAGIMSLWLVSYPYK